VLVFLFPELRLVFRLVVHSFVFRVCDRCLFFMSSSSSSSSSALVLVPPTHPVFIVRLVGVGESVLVGFDL